MNITKQQWTIIGVILAVVAIWYFFLRKKKAESGYNNKWQLNGSENGYDGSWLLESGYQKDWLTNGAENLESGYKMAMATDCPGCGGDRNKKPCGMDPSGCCPCGDSVGMPTMTARVSPRVSGLAATGISGTVSAKTKDLGIAGTGVGSTGTSGTAGRVKCPEGMSPFQATTPGGIKWGCKGYIPGYTSMQYADPI